MTATQGGAERPWRIDSKQFLLHPCHWDVAITTFVDGKSTLVAETNQQYAPLIVAAVNGYNPSPDATCYLERSEVRQILIGQPDESLHITEHVLSEIDALPIFTAADFPSPGSKLEAYRKALAGIVSECQRWRDEQPSSDGASKGWAQHIQGIAEAALRSAPVYGPATVSEPVAWRIRFPDGGCSQWFDGKPPKYHGPYEKAYASPQHVDREATVSARDGVIEAAARIADGDAAEYSIIHSKAKYDDALSVTAREIMLDRLAACARTANGIAEKIRSLASGAKP